MPQDKKRRVHQVDRKALGVRFPPRSNAAPRYRSVKPAREIPLLPKAKHLQELWRMMCVVLTCGAGLARQLRSSEDLKHEQECFKVRFTGELFADYDQYIDALFSYQVKLLLQLCRNILIVLCAATATSRVAWPAPPRSCPEDDELYSPYLRGLRRGSGHARSRGRGS
eukprot:259379-Rhodomonas_salina.2